MILGEPIGGALSSCKARGCQLLISSARSFQWESILQPEAPSVRIDHGVFAVVVWHHTCVQLSPSCRWVTRPSCLVCYRHDISVSRNLSSCCHFLLTLWTTDILELSSFFSPTLPITFVDTGSSYAPSAIVALLSSLFPFFFQAWGQLGLGTRFLKWLRSFHFVGLTSIVMHPRDLPFPLKSTFLITNVANVFNKTGGTGTLLVYWTLDFFNVQGCSVWPKI